MRARFHGKSIAAAAADVSTTSNAIIELHLLGSDRQNEASVSVASLRPKY
jgi:hypothetical protein